MTRDRIKMLGLVLLCASLTLAILLPAIGIQKVERDGILLNNTREVGIRVRNLPVWVVMTGSGLADLLCGLPPISCVAMPLDHSGNDSYSQTHPLASKTTEATILDHPQEKPSSSTTTSSPSSTAPFCIAGHRWIAKS
ncbi:MAG: hypothetical protein U0905_04570 [Pirellulales bacterium]